MATEYGTSRACRAVEAGNMIGNHSYNHPKFSRISLSRAITEIERTEDMINKIYAMAGVGRKRKFFRFPYGVEKKSLLPWLQESGFKVERWDCDTCDWMYYSREHRMSIGSIMRRCARAKDCDIVLTHDTKMTASNIIPYYVDSPYYELMLPQQNDSGNI